MSSSVSRTTCAPWIPTPARSSNPEFSDSQASSPLPRKPVIDRYSEKNHGYPTQRISNVVHECVIKKNGRGTNEERRHNWISSRSIGAVHVGLSLAEHKDGTRSHHIEEPLCKNREREQLPERSAHQHQQNCHHALNHQCQRWRMKSRMNFSQ